ncbi:anthranilate phosphoribosyltransferase [Halogranum amylolyticum]|uniref:Anthranilate phosphoribosyltransferase n=1 Tax=Halogranum amylolyticum TaxID=660520 RepID=A0A1H8UCN0_9EURY|nr:anthranilate phosphoribosyltransferase [Halogranum amylolyticum]SEP00623.1 anthranilate phosphoribosyltransferase [Halogranum amylolyticum]
MSTIEQYLELVVNGETLSVDEAREVSHMLFEDATGTQIGAVLAALRTKGESEAEIAGFAKGMRDTMRTIAPEVSPLVDICGTGGDDFDTINVSTTSAIVAAGAGVSVAKHGNYSVSSSSGSADVLDATGVQTEAEPPNIKAAIEDTGIGFLLAPVFNPAMERVIGPRKELGIRSIFNIIGPLTNPAGADAQVVGVYDQELVPMVAEALSRLDVKHGLVVYGSGIDEIAIHGETAVAEVTSSSIEEYTITPHDLGLKTHTIESVSGGTPEENAADMRGILTGSITGAKRDIVLANAGATVYVAGLAKTLEEGVNHARKAIESGAAAAKLEDLRA